MRLSKLNILSLSVFVAAMTMMSSAQAANSIEVKIQPDSNCSLNDGDTSIPVLTCYISLGIKTSSVSRQDLRLKADINEIPYAEDSFDFEIGPKIVEKNGVYAVELNFLDASIDGFDASESKAFKNTVIAYLQKSPAFFSVDLLSPSILVDRSQLGQILP